MGKAEKVVARIRRHVRVRRKIQGTAERPRISVYRSVKHIYAQVIDDLSRKTLVSASSMVLKGGHDGGGDLKSKGDKAKAVGFEIAKLAKAAGIEKVVFDRGGYLYHGRVKALAEAAREGGLLF